MLPHMAMLLRAARSMTTQPSDAEDLAQDVLLRAYLASDRFDGARPRAWLLTIMRNTHLNRVRARRPLWNPAGHRDEPPARARRRIRRYVIAAEAAEVSEGPTR